MSRKTKSLLSVLLIASMIAALLAGCTSARKKEPEGAGAAATNGAATDASSLDPLSAAAAEVIFEKVLSETETPAEFADTPTYEYTFQLGDSPEDNSFGKRYFEKKFNVKLNFLRLEGGNRKEQLNLAFATGTIPDLTVVKLEDIPEYARQGILAELPREMIEANMAHYYNLLQENDPTLLTITQIDGKNVGLARYYPNGGVPRPAGIRADWLQNVGVDKLPETLDELEEIFIKFRNDDPDGNGQKDTYAMSNGSDAAGETWFQSIFGAYGTNPFQWRDVDGKLQFGLTLPQTKEALLRLNKWYEMELIDPEFITDKWKNTEVMDIAGKFGNGKIGYLDQLGFDDYQFDNDGHVNFKWVVANQSWQQWFDERKDNPAEYYELPLQTDFNDELPQPYYINLPPVTGPHGDQGYYRVGLQEAILVFGKQLEEEPEKYAKLLQILDYINKDKPTNDMLEWGPDGVMMIQDETGNRIFNPRWGEHELFDPQIKKLGVVWTTNPMRWTNPDWLGTVGGPREEQRYKRSADVVRDFPYYEDALKVTLPSQAQYTEILDTRVKEYVIKAITGDIDIEATFDGMVEDWYKNGGELLTKEANDWYATQ